MTAITVNNVAPTVNAGPDLTRSEGDPSVTITASFTDPGSDTHTATITWRAGVSDTINPATSPISASHTYARDNGSYTVTVTVTDDDAGSGSDSLTVTVNNECPTINALTFNPKNLNINLPVSITGSFTDPGTLDTYTATIDWGDGTVEPIGQVSSPLTRNHEYKVHGRYPVKLTVTDDDGCSNSQPLGENIKVDCPAKLVAAIDLLKRELHENDPIVVRVRVTHEGECASGKPESGYIAQALDVTPSLHFDPDPQEPGNVTLPPKPNPPMANIEGGKDVSFEWVGTTKPGDKGKIFFATRIVGSKDNNSGAPIPPVEVKDLKAVNILLQKGRLLKAEIKVKPNQGGPERFQFSVGQPIEVEMTVTSLREEKVAVVRPDPNDLGAAGPAIVILEKGKGPNPPEIEIPAKEGDTVHTGTFNWIFTAAKAGTFTFAGQALGRDKGAVEDEFESNLALSEQVIIQAATQLKAEMTVLNTDEKPIAEMTPGQELIVQLKVTNDGEATAIGVKPTLTSKPEDFITAPQLNLVDASEKRTPLKDGMVDIPGKGAQTFEWTLTANLKYTSGEVTFTGSAVGKDNNSQKEVPAEAKKTVPIPKIGEGILVVTSLVIKAEKEGVPAEQGIISEGQKGIIEMEVKNPSGIDALNVKPTLLINLFIPLSNSDPAQINIPAGKAQTYRWTYETRNGSKGEGGASNELTAKLTVQIPAQLVIESPSR
ncbi:PKD domain-containing protein [Candidatus Poribacteria bacterium]|nr:PKD domain-containing protein [Candidatus Poribacteria bacterium]